MSQELVVGDRQRVEQELFARSVGAERVAEQGVFGGLVEGDPLLDAVAETGGDDTGVLGEALGRVAVQPAPRLLQPQREVPVEEGGYGADARRDQGVHQPVVEVEAAGGVHAGPGDREAVRVHAEVGEEGHVLGVAVVVVAGHVRRRAVLDVAGLGRERVPYRRVAFGRGSLDLVGRGGHAPEEAGRELR